MAWFIIITISLMLLAWLLFKGKVNPSSIWNKLDGQEHEIKTFKKEGITQQYKKHNVLFSPAERSFLGVLNQVIEGNAIIFGKVRVADVIAPIDGLPRKNWQILFNKISSKHFDFIVCDNKDLSILCAIELDDKSHDTKKRQDRDALLKNACSDANLPLIQIPAKSAYNLNEIRQTLITHLSANNA